MWTYNPRFYYFPSNEVHRVTNITSGKRKVLVFEFWVYRDAFYMERVDPYRQIVALGALGRITEKDHWWVGPGMEPPRDLNLAPGVMAASTVGAKAG